jgi:hypothetical protein
MVSFAFWPPYIRGTVVGSRVGLGDDLDILQNKNCLNMRIKPTGAYEDM